jgi:hypothetical protein
MRYDAIDMSVPNNVLLMGLCQRFIVHGPGRSIGTAYCALLQ